MMINNESIETLEPLGLTNEVVIVDPNMTEED